MDWMDFILRLQCMCVCVSRSPGSTGVVAPGSTASSFRSVADVRPGVVVTPVRTIKRYGDAVVALVELGAVVRVGFLEESAVVAVDAGRAGDCHARGGGRAEVGADAAELQCGHTVLTPVVTGLSLRIRHVVVAIRHWTLERCRSTRYRYQDART